MKRTILLLSAFFTVVLPVGVFANSAPVVSNVTAAQRQDASNLVDIYYDLADADGDTCTIWVVASNDGGMSWRVPVVTVSGEVGSGAAPGLSKYIIWDAGADIPGKVGNFRVRVYADDGKGPAPMVLVPAGEFPYQNTSDPAKWVFLGSFMIDKYEVTNQFYCQFLNNADPTGEHWDGLMEIDRSGDPANYYYTVVPGRENYPIRFVNCYDAEAFAAWRSNLDGVTYHLPTEQQWEKAAAWDPVQQHYYLYGFHRDDIDCTWCNYNYCYGEPLPVGSFNGTGGKNNACSYYGCYDMSGNLWEWTSSIHPLGAEYRVVHAGWAWDVAANCRTSVRAYRNQSWRRLDMGFRLVLDFQ